MRYRYEWRGKVYTVTLERHDGGLRATLDGVDYDLEVLGRQPGQLSLRFADRPRTLYWADDGGKKWVSMDGCSYLLEKPNPAARRGAEGAGEASLRAPMPAQVRGVDVRPGETVTKGQTLLILEAMKMEIRLQAPHAGRVIRLLVEPGQTVNRDQVLVEIRAPEDTGAHEETSTGGEAQ